MKSNNSCIDDIERHSYICGFDGDASYRINRLTSNQTEEKKIIFFSQYLLFVCLHYLSNIILMQLPINLLTLFQNILRLNDVHLPVFFCAAGSMYNIILAARV